MKEQAGFHAEDGEFASRVRKSFERQGLMKHLGAELVELAAGHAAIRVPFRAELTSSTTIFMRECREQLLTARAGMRRIR